MFQSLAATQAGCRRSFLRHLLHRITSLAISAIAALITLVVYAQTVHAESSERPNVLLIMTDDQGWGDIHSHGNEAIDTPVLDRLADAGARFDRFYVSPVCAPTRASLLTGRYHLRTGVHGVTRGMENMRSEETTVAELFRAAGYATGCFGKWHNGAHYPSHPNGQGFEQFVGFCAGHWNNYFDTLLERNGTLERTEGYITDVLTDEALNFIEKNREQPFFCYVPYNAPHSPWQVPDRYYDKYKERGLDDTTACAYAMVQNIDDNIGRLLAALDQWQLAENTIVLFLTDNGPNSNRYNGDMKGRKGSVHEGGVRVPLFMRWPGKIAAGTQVASITAHIDLLPTLCQLADVPVPDGLKLDGKSLVPLLTRPQAQKTWPDRQLFTFRQTGDARGAVRTPRWRAVLERRGWELYDMRRDPNQTKNLANSFPDELAELTEAYQQMLQQVSRQGFEPIPTPLGVEERPTVLLPGHEAFLKVEDATGVRDATAGAKEGISYHGRAGWANDWVTNWTSTNAYPEWPVQVTRDGEYEVVLHCIAPASSVGTRLSVEIGDQATEVEVREPHNPAALPSPDRIKRIEVYEKEWARLPAGRLTLESGDATLRVHAIQKPGEQVIDLKAVEIRRVSEDADTTRPNVILVMADDLGWGDVGFNGNRAIATPQLDKLAAAGLVFTRFYAAAPVCSPTRGSCLTGRHPYRYGIFGANTGHLPTDELTLVELLKQRGYRTGHFGKWHLGVFTKTERDSNRGGPKGAAHYSPPTDHGYDTYFATEAKVPTWDPLLRPAGINRRTWWDPIGPEQKAVDYGTAYWTGSADHPTPRRVTENTRGDDSRVLMDRALEFIEGSVAADEPFMAVVWFHAPHLPVVAGPQYTARYEDADPYTRHYYGCVTALDEQVGRLRARLRELNADQNTILCFCSDNGPEGQSGRAPGTAAHLKGRKRDLYEGGIRVPAVIEWPARIRPGQRTDVPAFTSDYLPTIADIVNAEQQLASVTLDGESLVPLFEDVANRRKHPMGFVSGKQIAWIDNQYKLIHPSAGKAVTPGGKATLDPQGFELYDLLKDPAESKNLANQLPDVRDRMLEELQAWRESVEADRAD